MDLTRHGLAAEPGFDKAASLDIICMQMNFARRKRPMQSRGRAGNCRLARYARPSTLDEALVLLSQGEWRVLAGGTDVYPSQGARPIRDDILDIGGVRDLRGVATVDGAVVIGARTTWTDIVRTPLPPAFAALQQAAREVGSIQIQNAGTVAGNLCNASPAADGVPALLVLDAEVELASLGGVRRLPLRDFLLGSRSTARRSDELVTAVRIPPSATAGHSAFGKLGARRYLVISIVMAAARLEVGEDGCVAKVAIAVGACSPVARRIAAAEAALTGRPAGDAVECLSPGHFDELSPIDDVRGSSAYRRRAAFEIAAAAVRAAVAVTAGQRSAA